jgi:tetratricopeptide (TPR) repeat protein
LRDIDQFNNYINLALNSYESIQDLDRILIFFINILSTLGTLEEFDNEEEILYYMLEYSEGNNLKGCKIIVLLDLGKIYLRKGNYERSEQSTLNALKIAQESNIRREICATYYDLAVIYKSKGENNKAINFAKKSIDISKEIGDIKLKVKNFLILGEIYYKLDKYLQSYRNYAEALTIFRNILDKLSKKELRGKYKENFQELPKILDKMNKILENSTFEPRLNELIEIKENGTKVCQTATENIEDFNTEKCKTQNEILKQIIVDQFKREIKEINQLLIKYNFKTALRDFNEAQELFDSKRKAPLSLIKNVLEGW